MNVSMRSLLAVALLATGGLACTAVYEDDMVSFATGGYAAGLRTMEMMHIIDTNKDGKISKDEWIAFQDRVFTALDKDKSGFLEVGEVYATRTDAIAFATAGYSRGLRTKEMFGKIDANHDGKVSRDEFIGYQAKIFDMMDNAKKQELGIEDFIVKTH